MIILNSIMKGIKKIKKQSLHKKLKYSSIAISGQPGAGRTTLLANLKPYLVPLGWEFFSGGDWSRQFSVKAGKKDPIDPTHHLATDYGEDIDYHIDNAMRIELA